MPTSTRDTPTEQWSPAAAPMPMLAISPRALPAGATLAGRYRIEAALGQGGMSVVYRARDQQTEQTVALKAFFPPPGVDEGAQRFQREFRALTRLQHARIVRVFDYGESDGVPFYVMELIAGSDLAAWRRARGGKLPLREVIAIGLQVCDALAYIHAQGIVHRDLKPSNLIVEETQPPAPAPNPQSLSVKLVDFGLAKLSDVSANLTASGIMLGTLNYMSPEQIQSLPVDPRADLYSLGVLLYELASGQLPFQADSVSALMLQHIMQTPTPLRSLEAAVPNEFEALVQALLAKRPSERPASAEVVAQALTHLTSLSAPTPFNLTASARIARADAVFRAGLIGRQAELMQLNDWLAQAWAGEGRLMLIEGEAGVGKSRLALELAGQVRLQGGRALHGACYEAERVPYGPIAEWLTAAAQPLADFRALVAEWAAELAHLVPRLVEAAPAARSGLDPTQAKLRFFDAVQQTLARLSAHKPLLFLLDDVQWADEATLECVHYLVRNARGLRIAFCATLRREAQAQAAALTNWLRDLSRAQLLTRVPLGRLSVETTEHLIAALLGVAQAPSELAARIFAESEGNPFFIEEMLKALAEEGAIMRRQGQWQLRAEAQLSALRIPSSIVDVVERRLASLADAERNALNWAATLGNEFGYEWLQRASNLEHDALLDALDQLLRGQLIAEVRDPRQDRYRFTHAKIREVVYGNLNAARRRRMHGKAGGTLEQLYPTRLDELSPILAYHYALDDDLQKAIRYNAQAGERARQVYANQEAINFYRQAIALSRELTTEAELEPLLKAHQGLGEVYQLIGEFAQAAEQFGALRDLAARSPRAPAERNRLMAEAWRGLGQTHESRGDYAESLRCYEQALAQLAEADDAERARVLNEMAWVFIHQGDYARAQQQCDQAIALAGGRAEVLATAYISLGDIARQQSDFEHAKAYYEQSLTLWEQIGNKERVALVLNNLGIIANRRENYAEANVHCQKALMLCREIGLSVGTAYLLNNLGVLQRDHFHELQAAYDCFQQSSVIFQRIGSKSGIALAYNNLATIYLALNEAENAMTYLLQTESIYQELNDRSSLAYTWMLIASAKLAHQQLAEAFVEAERALELATQVKSRLYVARIHRVLAQIHLAAGRMSEAQKHYVEACQLFEAMEQLNEVKQTRELFELALKG